MTKQPKALRLADAIDPQDAESKIVLTVHISKAAAELRRLHEVNAKLVEALDGVLCIIEDSKGVYGYHLNGDLEEWDGFTEVDKARDAIAKATGGEQ